MLVSKHRHGQVANYGFFIANSTDAVLRWHERLVIWALSPRYEDRVDQLIWHFALVGENPETCGRDCTGGAYTRAGAAGQVLHPPGVENIRFNKIPYEDLPHPHHKLKLESKKWADRAFALHLWSMHVGKPEQRVNRVKELGYLFVEGRPPAACDRLPH